MNYNIIGTLYTGAKIVGYRIAGSNGKELNIKYDDVVKLCNIGQIDNAEVRDIDNEMIVVVQGRHDAISCSSRECLELVDIVEENGKHEAYVKQDDGKVCRMELNELWFRAVEEMVSNVKAGVNKSDDGLVKTIEIFNR